MPTSGRLALAVTGLRIETTTGVEIVDDLDLELAAGEILALVGESGCGKSSVALGLLGYARPGTRIAAGAVRLDDVDVLSLGQRAVRRIRGNTITYVPQDPSKALSPRRTIGSQLAEAAVNHGTASGRARTEAVSLLDEVGLPTTSDFLRRYPFELSGGQQQRVLIAMALIRQPLVVVLDEPTTALDATTQARLLVLLRRIVSHRDVAVLYVTHDLAVVEQIADRVAVMYSGRVVETGRRKAVFTAPEHPYTSMLLSSIPGITSRRAGEGIPGVAAQPGERPSGCSFRTRCPVAIEICAHQAPPPRPAHTDGIVRCVRPGSLKPTSKLLPDLVDRTTSELPLLKVTDLHVTYGSTVAVDHASLSIYAGECLALVGESGSGKTTLSRCVAGLHGAFSGSIDMAGSELSPFVRKRTTVQRRHLQMIFQNPDRSLNPSHSVEYLLDRPLRVFGDLDRSHRHDRAVELLDRVRLAPSALRKLPGELSGGEKQRVAIARALCASPSLLICDEITSALDVSIQAAILELLGELRDSGVSLLFVTHNLSVVRSLANRVVVLRRGVVVEAGPTSVVIDQPRQDYTRELVNAAPELAVTGP
jgi:peptide/nickel transport system ATP-binding protein